MPRQHNIPEKLMSYSILINNAISENEIAVALAGFGYSAEIINGAKALLEESEALVQSQIKEYGEQYEATHLMEEQWKNTHKHYITALKVARIAFKDDASAQGAMMLNGLRKETLSGWMQQAKAFYNNLVANAEFMEAMAKFGYTAEKINTEKAMVDELESLKQAQAKEKGEARQATIDRDKKLDELDEWVSEFVVIARIALEGHPQWLEKLGILERS